QLRADDPDLVGLVRPAHRPQVLSDRGVEPLLVRGRRHGRPPTLPRAWHPLGTVRLYGFYPARVPTRKGRQGSSRTVRIRHARENQPRITRIFTDKKSRELLFFSYPWKSV